MKKQSKEDSRSGRNPIVEKSFLSGFFFSHSTERYVVPTQVVPVAPVIYEFEDLGDRTEVNTNKTKEHKQTNKSQRCSLCCSRRRVEIVEAKETPERDNLHKIRHHYPLRCCEVVHRRRVLEDCNSEIQLTPSPFLLRHATLSHSRA